MRIVGRSPDFTPPSDAGICEARIPTAHAAWVILSMGDPFRQVRCRVTFGDEGVYVSDFTGELASLKRVRLSADGNYPAALGDIGTTILRDLVDIGAMNTAMPRAFAVGDRMGSWRALSVSPSSLFFVLLTSEWSSNTYDDWQIRLNPQGKFVSCERVRMKKGGQTVQASRQLWFFDSE